MSALTKAYSPKYGSDCLRWESATSFLKLSEHKALERKPLPRIRVCVRVQWSCVYGNMPNCSFTVLSPSPWTLHWLLNAANSCMLLKETVKPKGNAELGDNYLLVCHYKQL